MGRMWPREELDLGIQRGTPASDRHKALTLTANIRQTGFHGLSESFDAT
jgi:hypothetical protein